MPKLPNTIQELGYKSPDLQEQASFNAAKEGYVSADKQELASFIPSARNDIFANIKKQLEEAKTKALDIQKQAQALADKQKTSSQDFVSSSEPVVQDNVNITKDVKGITPTPPADGIESAQTASDEYLRLIDEQTAALEKRRKETIANIESQFAGAKSNLEQKQKSETGTTSTTIARLGGYLGPSASAQGVMLNLARTHRDEVTTLEGKKREAINQANNAITDKQFDLARIRVQEVKDIEKTIHDRKTEFFNQSLDLIQESRRSDEFFRAKIKDDLKAFGEVAIADESIQLDPARVAEIDDFYGVKGFTQQYLDTIRTAAKIKSEKDRVSAQKNVIDLLEKIPVGQELAFPDGTVYTGLGKATDIFTSLQTNDNGYANVITYNKRTGQINVNPVGQVGKTKDATTKSDPVVQDNIINKLQIQMEAQKMEDGSYDPDSYIRERNFIKEVAPEMLKRIDSIFLNPTNEFFTVKSIDRLREKGIAAPKGF